jgi:pilus assembly protein CpaB
VLSGALRDRALPLAAVGLALLGLAVGQGGDGPRRLEVVVAARSIAAGTPIPPDAIRLVSIAAADRTPSMLVRIDEAAYRQSGVPLRAGDYVVRGALQNDDRAALRRGQRAVALRLDAAAAPSPAALRDGARVDVVVSTDADATNPARSSVVASALEVLGAPRRSEGTVVVTLRASLRQAVALTAAQSYAHDLRVLVRAPGDVRAGTRVTVDAASLGGSPGG